MRRNEEYFILAWERERQGVFVGAPHKNAFVFIFSQRFWTKSLLLLFNGSVGNVNANVLHTSFAKRNRTTQPPAGHRGLPLSLAFP